MTVGAEQTSPPLPSVQGPARPSSLGLCCLRRNLLPRARRPRPGGRSGFLHQQWGRDVPRPGRRERGVSDQDSSPVQGTRESGGGAERAAGWHSRKSLGTTLSASLGTLLARDLSQGATRLGLAVPACKMKEEDTRACAQLSGKAGLGRGVRQGEQAAGAGIAPRTQPPPRMPPCLWQSVWPWRLPASPRLGSRSAA